ncbi:MAG TPA: hypothetical protein VFN67_35265 [Polyangiales bacterium]|nr:hypothetical protein [Polyangiales bacterium]
MVLESEGSLERPNKPPVDAFGGEAAAELQFVETWEVTYTSREFWYCHARDPDGRECECGMLRDSQVERFEPA